LTVDLRKIKKLIELVEESGLTELEVRDGDEAVRIARAAVVSSRNAEEVPGAAQASPGAVRADAGAQSPRAVVDAQAVHAAEAGRTPGFIVEAPLTGTFYRAPAPGEKPFVNSGKQVNIGDVLCIIESMKMMNHIEAERAGKVTAVLVEDGQPVEMGRSLFVID